MGRKQVRARSNSVIPAGHPVRLLDDRPIPSSADLGVDEGRFGWLERGHIAWLREAHMARTRVIAEADAALRVAVDAARVGGLSWGAIGFALGVTKQSASERFGS